MRDRVKSSLTLMIHHRMGPVAMFETHLLWKFRSLAHARNSSLGVG
jgi:hypothetical protein